MQIGLVDVLREEYGITPAGFLGHSAGVPDLALIHIQCTLDSDCWQPCAAAACPAATVCVGPGRLLPFPMLWDTRQAVDKFAPLLRDQARLSAAMRMAASTAQSA